MAFETMTTASAGTGYTPSEDAKRTGNIQFLYDRRVEVLDVVTAETTIATPGTCANLYSYTVPGSTLGTDGLLILDAAVTWTKDATNTAIRFDVNWAGSTIGNMSAANGAGTGSGLFLIWGTVKARGTTGSQFGISKLEGYNVATGANVVGYYSAFIPGDSSASQLLLITTCMLGAAGTMSVTLNYAKLEYCAAR